MQKFFIVLIIVGLVLWTGCGSDNSADSNLRNDLIIELSGMGAHTDQEIQMRVIDTNDVLLSLAVIDVLPDDYLKINLSNLVDEKPDRLDFYADVNENGEYDAPPDDHAWRVSIPENGRISFSDNSDYTDISDPEYTLPGKDFVMNFQNYTDYIGQKMELRVIEKQSGQRIGYYLLNEIPNSVFTIYLPDIIVSGTTYQIDFYIDRNVNGIYDTPPEDPAWRVELQGSGSGINVNFSNNSNYTDIGA